MGEAKETESIRAIDYIREHSIEQKIEEFIGQVVHERPLDPYGVLSNRFASQSEPPTIAYLKGREILLSTGRPSLQVDVYVNMLGRIEMVASSNAPIGTSVFNQEPKPHLDTNTTRFLGFGSRNACSIVDVVSATLQGKQFTSIDQFDLIVKKALENKTGITNVFSSISFALAKASAEIAKKQAFLYLYESLFPQQSVDHFAVPTPAVTLIQGGMHAEAPLLFESIFIIPKPTLSFIEQLRVCAEVSYKMQQKLFPDGAVCNIGKAGGFVCDAPEIATAIGLVEKAISDAGFVPNADFTIGIDCAASFFYDPEKQRYQVEKGVFKSAAELVQYYIDLITQHPSIAVINDGISDLDHGGWELMRDALTGRVKVYGGDIYGSQAMQSRRGLKKHWTDGVFLQPGQAGTISEAAETAKLFKQRGKQIIVARRSGETCDSIIADFAVAVQAEYFLAGGLNGSEGTAKYNHMLRIYEYLRDKSMLQ